MTHSFESFAAIRRRNDSAYEFADGALTFMATIAAQIGSPLKGATQAYWLEPTNPKTLLTTHDFFCEDAAGITLPEWAYTGGSITPDEVTISFGVGVEEGTRVITYNFVERSVDEPYKTHELTVSLINPRDLAMSSWHASIGRYSTRQEFAGSELPIGNSISPENISNFIIIAATVGSALARATFTPRSS